MKYAVYTILFSLSSVILFSCTKQTDSDFQDYYHNKKINVKIENIDMSSSDKVDLLISAFKVEQNPNDPVYLTVNGELYNGQKSITINQDLLKDNIINVATQDSAWQMVFQYSFNNDNGPTTIIFTPSFDDEVRQPISFYLDPNVSKSGTFSIKYYQ